LKLRLNKSKSLVFGAILVFISVAFFSCSDQKESYELNIPDWFPKPEIPADNPLTTKKVKLGEQLFFDARLSSNFLLSCASCHLPAYAFSDTVAFSSGVHERSGERNSPTLVNVAYKPHFFKDGGIESLELQALAPIDHPSEMDISTTTIVDRLRKDSLYQQSFKEVFNSGVTMRGITYALAAYQRTLIYGNSKYDQVVHEKSASFSDLEKRGQNLFNSDSLNCSKCHSGVFFTDYSFQNNGLKANYADSGRAKVTSDADDAGKFVVPTLRNVEITGPYMYDGSLKSLSQVVDHYASGGSDHRNKSALIDGFSLSDNDKKALIAYLKTLTDKEFQQNPNQ
jgi:cytochrome c peroxidase